MIVTYNSERVIGNCLEALARMAPEVQAVVVDNASSDSSAAQARAAGAEVIANRENRGFAAAVNQGFRVALSQFGADFVLLLNPDVSLTSRVDRLIGDAGMSSGITAGQLTDSAGRPQEGFTIRRLPTAASLSFELLGINRIWAWNPVNRRYRYLDRDLSKGGEVEQPAGAFLMIRRMVWEVLEGFDEGFYPVWFEDVDFCKRALERGFRVDYVPEVTAIHQGGHSVRQVPSGCRMRYWYVSLLRYAAKHLRPPGYRAVWLAAVLGALPRMILGMIHDRSLRRNLSWAGAVWGAFGQAKTGQNR